MGTTTRSDHSTTFQILSSFRSTLSHHLYLLFGRVFRSGRQALSSGSSARSLRRDRPLPTSTFRGFSNRCALSLITLFIVVPSIATAQTQITLEEAIEISLDNNFQLQQAHNSLEISELQVTSAKADFLPSLNGSFNGQQNVGRQFIQETATFEDRTTYSLSGGLSLGLDIFTGFQNINNLRRSRVLHNQQEANTDRIRENIIFNTAMRYLQVLLDMELLEIAEQNLETSQIQLEQVDAQVEVGSRPIVDLYQQESIVASNELQVVQAENALNFSRSRLVRMLQIDPLQEYEFVAPDVESMDLTPQQIDLEDMIQQALTNRSDLRVQELGIQAARYDLDIALSNRLPTVTAFANLNSRYSDQWVIAGEQVSFSDQFFDQMISRSAGFSISIPLFNRWNTNTSIQQARINRRNAELTLDDIRFEIREEISQAYNDYISLVKELEVTARSLRAAERAYETQRQRYEIGATSLIELNIATTDYMEAQSNRQQVLYNFIFQERLLDYFIGRISDFEGGFRLNGM